jgi:cell division septation protein DedD
MPFQPADSQRPDKKQEVNTPIRGQPAKDLYREKPSVPAAPAPPAADTSETKSSAGDSPQALPRHPETTPEAVPEEKNVVAVVTPKEEISLSVSTIPPAESQKESPVVSSRTETVEKQEYKPAVEEPKVEQKIEATKAPPTKEKPKADSTPARSPSGVIYPFSLFLGSVPHLEQAEQGVSKYRKNGLSAYYAEVELSTGIWYRLYAGYFESAEQAERFKREKNLEGAEVKETPFANLIGTFTSKDKLESKIQSLKSIGFSAYAVRDADGKERLLVGAFYNEKRAKRQYEELKSKGIENQIVQR